MNDSSAASVQPVVARARRGYCFRLLAVGLGMCAVSAWFAFDASVTYPAHNRQWEEAARFRERHGGRAAVLWPQHAKEAGLDPNFNAVAKTDPPHSRMDILTQWGLGGATLVLGLLSLGGFALVRRRRVTWDGQVLADHRGVRIPRAGITAVDASRWADKGVFTVRGTTQDGRAAAIELDDWKLETEAVEAIHAAMKAVESGAAGSEDRP